MAQAFETHRDAAVEPPERHGDICQQARDGSSVDRVRSARRKRDEAFFRGRYLPGQELTFGSMEAQAEDQIVPALPAVLSHQCRASIRPVRSSIGLRFESDTEQKMKTLPPDHHLEPPIGVPDGSQ